MPRAKKLRKTAGIKRTTRRKAAKPTRDPQCQAPIDNPDEPIRANWAKVPCREFEQDRLIFNPYAFGQSTCRDDSRFYCKMHQQVYHHRISKKVNSHVPTFYFNLENARDLWSELMKLCIFMEYLSS